MGDSKSQLQGEQEKLEPVAQRSSYGGSHLRGCGGVCCLHIQVQSDHWATGVSLALDT